MRIEYEEFLSWVKTRFPDYRERNGEIKINSIFIDDYKKHLWCNPEKNAFHCWKSGKTGNLLDLVHQVDGISYADAKLVLGINDLRYFENDVGDFLSASKPVETPKEPIPDSITLPPSTFLIDDLSEMSKAKQAATNYLTGRKIPTAGLYICTEGKYKDRVIIPYRLGEGNLIYWNGRDISGKSNLRYRGPDKDEYKIGKEDVIYFYKYPPKGTEVFVTEGEFDAITLTLCGFFGVAVGGKEVYEKQVKLLRDFKICLSFDNDEAGLSALNSVGTTLLKEGHEMTFVRPPSGYKDWNALFVVHGDAVVKEYIIKNKQKFDQWTTVMLFGR